MNKAVHNTAPSSNALTLKHIKNGDKCDIEFLRMEMAREKVETREEMESDTNSARTWVGGKNSKSQNLACQQPPHTTATRHEHEQKVIVVALKLLGHFIVIIIVVVGIIS